MKTRRNKRLPIGKDGKRTRTIRIRDDDWNRFRALCDKRGWRSDGAIISMIDLMAAMDRNGEPAKLGCGFRFTEDVYPPPHKHSAKVDRTDTP